MPPISSSLPLLADVRLLINAARQRVASTVNAELTQLYWQIGKRVNSELLQGQRAEYGKQVIAELAKQLTTEFGKGWSAQQIRHCLRLAEVFSDDQILSTVRRELTWSHIKALIYIDEPLKRDFYIEICRIEHWSVRQLQERINSMLFERTAISKKPEETIKQDLAQLRNEGQQSSPSNNRRSRQHNSLPRERGRGWGRGCISVLSPQLTCFFPPNSSAKAAPSTTTSTPRASSSARNPSAPKPLPPIRFPCIVRPLLSNMQPANP